MLKYLLPVICLTLAGCNVYTYPGNPYYYDYPPPQPTNYYSYQNLQTPMTPMSMRHPFIPTTPATQSLTPAMQHTRPIYSHGPVISSGPKKKATPADNLVATVK